MKISLLEAAFVSCENPGLVAEAVLVVFDEVAFTATTTGVAVL